MTMVMFNIMTIPVLFISFNMDSAMMPMTEKMCGTFHITIGEDNGISPLTKRKVKPKSSFVGNY